MGYDARKVAQKQIRNAGAAVEDYKEGVRNVKVAPSQLAIKKKAKMRQNVLAAIDNGKWEGNLSRWGLADWQERTVDKGGRNFASGVQDSEEKTIAFHEEWARHVDQVQAKLAGMDDTTPEQNEQRMLENLRMNRKFKRSGRR